MTAPDTDVLVVGAGPAGLAAALYARDRGLTVQVVDPRGAPIDKACGEGLMPGAVAALRSLGVDVPGRPIAGIRYLGAGSRAQARFRAGPGLGVRRTALAEALLSAARERGVHVDRIAAGPLSQDADGVTAAGMRARYLIAADGLHSPIRRRLGLDAAVRGAPRWGLRRHFAVTPWTDLVEVHWARHAEAYVTPVGPEQIGVAVLSGRRGRFDEHLAAFPELTARLAGADGTAVRGAGPLHQRARHRVQGRVLLVGDAAGYVDALTGEGIAVALAGASAAVGCLARDRPQDYEQEWAAATRRYRWLTGGLLTATRAAPIRRALVPAAAALPAVFGGVVNALAGSMRADEAGSAAGGVSRDPHRRRSPMSTSWMTTSSTTTPSTTTAPPEQVVLCAPDGSFAGVADKASVHTTDTPLHLAFSCYVVDTAGRLLVTRRASSKITWPGVRTNSCCGHPAPGEPIADAVRRRLTGELGLQVRSLDLVLPRFRYRSVMADGTVENELCPVFRAVVEEGVDLHPAATEVDETWWQPWPEFVADAVTTGADPLSPWAALQAAELTALGPDPLTWALGDPAEMPAAAVRS